MRHHLPANLAEPAQSIGNSEEPVLVLCSNVSSYIPAVLQHLRGLVRPPEVSLHDIGPAHQHQPRSIHWQALPCLWIHNPHTNPWQGMPNTPALRADLAKARRAEIARIHSDHRRTFRSAISLQRTDAKAILESQRERLRQLFRTYYHVL